MKRMDPSNDDYAERGDFTKADTEKMIKLSRDVRYRRKTSAALYPNKRDVH